MKYLIIPLLFISCNSGLSKKDKDHIQAMIDMHNTIAKGKYREHLINAETEATIKYLNYKLQDSLVKLSLNSASLGYNIPYDFRKDTAVTMESYLTYCKAYGYDPVEYSSRIDKN